MTDPRPLLAFPPPESGDRSKGAQRNPGRPHGPSSGRQVERITPQFRILADALAAGRANASTDGPGTDPELVAVFDLAGTVDGFLRAIQDIDGLEFLADLVGDGFDPDDDFYIEKKGAASDLRVPESLYVLMTNARAIDELISLFDRWVADPSVELPLGMAPLKDVFAHLRAIRRWSPEDRVRATGLLDRWAETLAVVGASGSARVEVELWYREAGAARTAAEGLVQELITQSRGAVLQTLTIPDIRYHALLADLPHDQVETVLANGPGAIALLTADEVMFVTPAVPMAVETPQAVSAAASDGGSRPTGPPRVALLDGLPLANHQLLDGRLIIDDPDDFTTRYGAGRRGHGTSMASLICHGDLADGEPPLTAPVYVRPVLEPHHVVPSEEVTPADQLLVDLIHRCFHRMFEGDANNPPAAPSVRVVNLSVGDPARVFARQLSPLARLLDWLAFKYNRVIVVSAGNHPQQVISSHAEVDGDLDDARTAVAVRLRDGAALRRMLSPAEAINVLTVGAVHADGSSPDLPDHIVDLVEPGSPASYTPAGTGYRRSVKPELLLPGGRQVHVKPADGAGLDRLVYAPATATGPGQLTAGYGAPGAVDGVVHTYGTSNSAALASRYLDQILEVLASVTPGAGLPPMPDPQYHPVLARAMLVHTASWGEAGTTLRRQLGIDGMDARKELVQLLGYGPVSPERLLQGDRVRAVLVGAGSIGKDERRTFRFPLPQSLRSTTMWRRVTVTLSWLSPINPRSQRYRVARLHVAPPTDDIGVARLDVPHYAPGNGTVQHEVLEGERAVAFQSGDDLEISVECFVDAGTATPPVRFGLVVTVEVAEGVLIDIHSEVQDQLRARIRGSVRARAVPGS